MWLPRCFTLFYVQFSYVALLVLRHIGAYVFDILRRRSGMLGWNVRLSKS